MGRGRPKTPDAIKQLTGDPGKRGLNGDAPMPLGEVKMPSYVQGYAADVWVQVVESMPKALYTSCDSVLLAAFCVAAGQFAAATEEINKDGITVHAGQFMELKPHPALSAQSKALTTLGMIGARLGLEPCSRASLKMPSVLKPDSKFDGLMGGKEPKKDLR